MQMICVVIGAFRVNISIISCFAGSLLRKKPAKEHAHDRGSRDFDTTGNHMTIQQQWRMFV